MRFLKKAAAALLAAALAAALAGCQTKKEHNATTFAMDTLVTQQAYGPKAQEAMRQVNAAFAEYTKRLSLFEPEGDIGRVNAAAGGGAVAVDPHTAELLEQALALSAQSEGAFALSIAPLTLAWGVTGENPRVPRASLK